MFLVLDLIVYCFVSKSDCGTAYCGYRLRNTWTELLFFYLFSIADRIITDQSVKILAKKTPKKYKIE